MICFLFIFQTNINITMTPNTLFYILIGILIINFMVDKIVDSLNAKHFDDAIPSELSDVYDETEYKKSQAYKKANHRFSNITSLFSLIMTILFFFLDGFIEPKPFFNNKGFVIRERSCNNIASNHNNAEKDECN